MERPGRKKMTTIKTLLLPIVMVIALMVCSPVISQMRGRSTSPGDTVYALGMVEVPGGRLQIRYKDQFTPETHKLVEAWLSEAGTAITTLYGEFPFSETTVDIRRSGRSRGPVPWGMVERSNGTRVVFHISPDFSLDEFRADWTAAHELSHLLVPYTGSTGRWFSEGIASFMQNTLRARHTMIDEQTAWEKIYAGFLRGKDHADKTNTTLREVSEGRSRGGIMRIHWTGVAFFLNVDLRLRSQSNLDQSLDQVLKAFKDCCLDPSERWELEPLIAKLDELSGTRVFSDEYHRIIDEPDFPDYIQTFDQLGIRIDNNHVVLGGGEQEARLRAAILGPRTTG
jgi:hypothetical protein